jgi:DNA-binding MarR family transcriptional regulator
LPKPAEKEVFAVLNAVLSLSRRLRAERPAGAATLGGYSILAALQESGPLPSNRLAAQQGLEPQSLTRVLADLESRGFIARQRSDRDRRTVLVSLTEAGGDALRAEAARRCEWFENAIASALDDSERNVLFAAGGAMAKLARFEASPTPD